MIASANERRGILNVTLTFRAEIEAAEDGTRAVVVAGELDQATLPELQRALDEVIETGSGNLLIDLSECSFIDSSGLAALVSARERMTAAGDGRRFAICCGSPQVQRLLEITGLDKAMGVVATRDEALEALRSA
jgi:anti-anti-sigma factor